VVSFETKLLSKFIQEFKLDRRKRQENTVRALEDAAQVLIARAQERLTAGNPIHVRTGRLRSSIRHSKTVVSGKTFTITVGTNVFYGRFLEFGGGAPPLHHVFPKEKKFMRFRASSVGGVRTVGAHGKDRGPMIFAKKVVMKPKPWLIPSLEESRPKILEVLARAGMDIKAAKGAGG